VTARLPFTQAGLTRAIVAAEKAGKRVVGIKPDGTLIVDSGDGPHPLVPADDAEGQVRPASKWEDARA